jgi:chlorite dismutase
MSEKSHEEKRPAESHRAPGLPTVDTNEYGGKKEGVRQQMDRRLFMQLIVFDVPSPHAADRMGEMALGELRKHKVPAVAYADVNHPRGVGLLTWSEDPGHFLRYVRPLFSSVIDGALVRAGWTMLGRTYATGHEPDLEHVLLRRAPENVLSEKYPWHVWYPLRRTGSFAKLAPEEQGSILREHAQIGMAYGHQELAHDVRLACHGIDAADNEFVIGIISHSLHPLSHLVQTMRRTKQTSEYIAQMGPFFVGHVLGRSGPTFGT